MHIQVHIESINGPKGTSDDLVSLSIQPLSPDKDTTKESLIDL